MIVIKIINGLTIVWNKNEFERVGTSLDELTYIKFKHQSDESYLT